MKSSGHRFFLFVIPPLWLVLAGCGDGLRKEFPGKLVAEKRKQKRGESIPLPRREFRGAWVATVNNIDWPSRPGLPENGQRDEAEAILDRFDELNLNAVILQVRPQADTLYPSEIEPWSYFLTGEQGRGPENPQWDPLQFWIEEAHRRGLQLHAWFNPFRANHGGGQGAISEKSIIKVRPDLVHRLGDQGYWWIDPSKDEGHDHIIRVITDVIKRYDIDGVHLDDYFYPYPTLLGQGGFPDDASFADYQEGGGRLERDDWRRDSIDRFIKKLSKEIRRADRRVQFGVSPFGIWRPGHPNGVIGLDQFGVIYSDPKRWLNEGWVDYLMPQLYWPISSDQSFSELLTWWSDQNLKGRHLWPGLKIAGIEDEIGRREILNQIMFTRALCRTSPGTCLFSARWLMTDPCPIADDLSRGPWSEPAMIPSSPWLEQGGGGEIPLEVLEREGGGWLLRFETAGEDVLQFVLNEKKGSEWRDAKLIPTRFRSYPISSELEAVALRSMNRFGKVSEAVVIEFDWGS